MKKPLLKRWIVACLLPVLGFVACKEPKEIKLIELKPVQTLTALNDSSYFKYVSGITVDDDFVYASDGYNGRVIKMDKDLNLVSFIGFRGQGPGGFTYVGPSVVQDDTVYVVENGFKLNVFDKKDHFVRSSTMMDHSLRGVCGDNDGHLYLSSRLDSLPIVKYDRCMNRLGVFGEWVGTAETKHATDLYHLCLFNNQLLAVSEDTPRLYLYDKDGTLRLQKSLDEPMFKSRLDFKEGEWLKYPSNKKKTYSLFTSIATYGNKVYLLYIDHDPVEGVICKKLVELTYEDNDFRVSNHYALAMNGWYTVINLLDEDRLIAFNATASAFCVYDL